MHFHMGNGTAAGQQYRFKCLLLHDSWARELPVSARLSWPRHRQVFVPGSGEGAGGGSREGGQESSSSGGGSQWCGHSAPLPASRPRRPGSCKSATHACTDGPALPLLLSPALHLPLTVQEEGAACGPERKGGIYQVGRGRAELLSGRAACAGGGTGTGVGQFLTAGGLGGRTRAAGPTRQVCISTMIRFSGAMVSRRHLAGSAHRWAACVASGVAAGHTINVINPGTVFPSTTFGIGKGARGDDDEALHGCCPRLTPPLVRISTHASSHSTCIPPDHLLARN